jgi:hypothetical protein
MLQQMREYWNQANAARNSLVAEELVHARARQAEAHAYWGTHKAAVKARWKSRTGLRSA